MSILGLNDVSCIDDEGFLREMKSLTTLHGDGRVVWIGSGYAKTNVEEYKPQAQWANQHWALYYGFINDMEIKDKTILDLGCGVGVCTANLSTVCDDTKIIGYDIDKEMVDFANQYNSNETTSYVKGDISNSDLPKDNDYIFLIEILEHIKHSFHYKLIDEALSLLKDEESRIFLSTPNEELSISGDRGHVGIMNKKHFQEFKTRYEKNIISIQYYDNTKLIGHHPNEYTSNNGSHFKITLKK